MDPAFKERVTAAFDGLAARSDTEQGGFFGPVSDLLVQVAGLRSGQVVLDVGCGAGACLLAAARTDGSLRRGLGFCYTRATWPGPR